MRLPLPPRREGPGAFIALVVHGLIVFLMLWPGYALLQKGAGVVGVRGGGGAGRRAVRWFALPAPSRPQAFAVPAAPVVAVPDIPLPGALQVDLAQIQVPRPEVTGGGPGPGSGRGGSEGTGAGTGAGSAVGPGTGGEGGYIFPATPRWAIFPPPGAPAAVRGRPHQVRFWVTADGRVTKVEVNPPIKDAAYRREFYERMMGYLFTPATTRDGLQVDYVASVTVIP